jgi:DNA-binding XRE family transcriptional regulator
MAIPADDVFAQLLTPEQRAEADKHGQELLAQYLTLQQLRKARDMTQVALAKTLGKEQVAISQIEKRTDMLLSTLRGYVEAMGGNLSLVVQFDDRNPVFLTGLNDDEPRSWPRPPVERVRE